MQIYYNQLSQQLQENLKPIYIITGNDIYQEESCVQKIIVTAHKANFIEHEIFYVENFFDWNNYELESLNLSLFSEKKITELRFLTKTVSSIAEKKIFDYIENFDKNKILIFRLPELKSTDYKKKYLYTKNNNVGIIRIFPFTKKNMIEEIKLSSKKVNLKVNDECINFIADIYEGNMLAANQAIVRLSLMINHNEEINLNFLSNSLSKDVYFEANSLVDYSIIENIEKIQTCINFLRENNYPVQYIIWSFIRFFRSILFNIYSVKNGKSKNEILDLIWPYERKKVISYALEKLSEKKIESYLGILIRLDYQSKNIINGNAWDSIYDLSISVAKNRLSVIKYT